MDIPHRFSRLWFAVGAVWLSGCSNAPRSERGDAGDAGDAACRKIQCTGTCVAEGCLLTLAEPASPRAVVVDVTSAYFTTCSAGVGSVDRVPLSGGQASLLASTPTCAVGLALDATNVYWAELGGEIAKVPLGGGAMTTLASSTGTPVGVAVDGANVYWTTSTALMLVPLGGGGPTTLASGHESSTRPVLDATNVYWGDPKGGTIWTVPKSGGSPAALTSGLVTITDLAVGKTDVYFGGAYILMKVPIAGGTPTTLAAAAGEPIGDVTNDDENVYFTSDDSTIWKVPANGGAVVALAANQGFPTDITVDGTSVYWTSIDSPPEPGGSGGRVVELMPK